MNSPELQQVVRDNPLTDEEIAYARAHPFNPEDEPTSVLEDMIRQGNMHNLAGAEEGVRRPDD